jgi:hypothetical protein
MVVRAPTAAGPTTRSCGGACTPWELASACPGAELIIVEDSGHTGSTTMTHEMHTAADCLYDQITNPR